METVSSDRVYMFTKRLLRARNNASVETASLGLFVLIELLSAMLSDCRTNSFRTLWECKCMQGKMVIKFLINAKNI